MPDIDWKDALRTVAPALATALGGPLAGAAVAQLGAVLLGNPQASQADVAAAIGSAGLSADQALALQKAEQDFAVEMERLRRASEDAGLADTAGARQQTIALASTGSAIAWGAPVVSGMVVVGYFFCIWLLFVRGEDLPDNITQIVNIMFGALQAGFIQVVNYWLGSSAGSKRSGDAVRAVALGKAG